MPHLRYAGRLWRVSSDELSVPIFCAGFFRFLWLIIISVILGVIFQKLAHDCRDGWTVILYLFLTLVCTLVSILCEVWITAISLKGSVVDTAQRDDMKPCLDVHVILAVIQLLCAIYGICLANVGDIPCANAFSSQHIAVLLYVLVISQLVDFFGLLCCCTLFSSKTLDDITPSSLVEDISTWESRCKSICRSIQICTCNVFGGGGIGEDLEAVGRIFAHFFHHEGFLDVVPSDVVVGIILLRHHQKLQRNSQKELLRSMGSVELGIVTSQPQISPSTSASSMNDEEACLCASEVKIHEATHRFRKLVDASDVDWLADAAHFMSYALAAYTYLMYLYINPCCGLCKLCCRQCDDRHEYPSESSPLRGSISGDNMCGFHKTAMLKMAYHSKSQLVFANFSNDISIKPYAIFVDHEKQAIVISIRGTLSLEDCVTDAMAHSESLEAAGLKWGFDGAARYGHSGMIRSAMWIRNDLEEKGILTDIMIGNRGFMNDGMSRGGSINSAKFPLNQAYSQIIVVGHSLGAGTAVILTMLLRPAYPTVRCYAYGTPGSVLDKQSCQDCAEYVTSVVLGNDLVCRLSIKALDEMREKVLDYIVRCRVNKMAVMQSLFKTCTSNDLNELMYASGEEPDSDFKRMVSNYKLHMQRKSNVILSPEETLHHPGRIIQLKQLDDRRAPRCGNSKHSNYVAFEANWKDYESIVISSTMVWEHLPDRYVEELNNTVEEMKSGV